MHYTPEPVEVTTFRSGALAPLRNVQRPTFNVERSTTENRTRLPVDCRLAGGIFPSDAEGSAVERSMLSVGR
jgi:hypothetical protein